MKIKSIKKRTSKTDVFCLTVPETSELILANGVVIGNCLYNGSAFGLATKFKIEPSDAEAYVQAFFDSYPEFKVYMEARKNDAKQRGYVKTLLGKKRRIPQLLYVGKDSRKDLHELESEAINAPVQGSSGGTTIKAMTWCWREIKARKLKSRILNNVHDSILFEVYEPEFDEMIDLIEKGMTQPYYENVGGNKAKLKIDLNIGKVWDFGVSLKAWREKSLSSAS